MGHLRHLSRPGHRVIILTRCETRVFSVFEKNAQNAEPDLKEGKLGSCPGPPPQLGGLHKNSKKLLPKET